jgi:hypothetical protein
MSRDPSALVLDRVKRAVVRLPKLGGRGVLVPGGFILTAAHCVSWELSGRMALGYDFLEPAVTAAGRKLRLSVYAVEPVQDIAVLGPPDNQHLPDDADAFDEFCARTAPVPPFRGRMAPADVRPRYGPRHYELPVLMLNRDGRWVGGLAQVTRPDQADVFLRIGRRMQGGASGGPIVTAAGELVATVSQGNQARVALTPGGPAEFDASGPRPLFALPAWVRQNVLTAMRRGGPAD